MVAVSIAALLAKYGGVGVPIVNMSLAALVSAVMKYFRDKYPDNPILTWLPV